MYYFILVRISYCYYRSRHLEETAFLNFTVTSFLESNFEKLKELKSELEKCEIADENSSVVQKYIEEFSHMLEMEPMWNGDKNVLCFMMCDICVSILVWPEEDLSRVNDCLTNHVFAHVYQQTFRPNGESDVQRDQ